MAATPGALRPGGSRRPQSAKPAAIMKKLDVPQSGKLGVTVSVKTRYGQVQRQYIIPKDPHTADQIRVRTNLGHISARWRTLTPEQRFAWTIAGRAASTRSVLGRSAPLTGCQLFIKINCARAAIGAELLLMPPPPPNFGPNPVGDLLITNGPDGIALRLSVAAVPEAHISVYGAAPCSAGITFVRNFTMLGRLPDPVAGVTEITDLYVARYGVPLVGLQVCIRTRQQINGWQDLPRQVSAIVPAC